MRNVKTNIELLLLRRLLLRQLLLLLLLHESAHSVGVGVVFTPTTVPPSTKGERPPTNSRALEPAPGSRVVQERASADGS